MEISTICKKILAVYQGAESAEKRSVIKWSFELRSAMATTALSLEAIQSILAVAKEVALTKGSSKQRLEKQLLDTIAYLPHQCWENRGDDLASQLTPGNPSAERQIADALIAFAKEIYDIKLRRDAFAGKRKIHAIQILEGLEYYCDVPEFVDLCTRSVQSKSKIEFIESVDYLTAYYETNDQVPSKALLETIAQRLTNTKDRAEAVSALNFQVALGIIDEMEAMFSLELWEE